MVIQSLSRANSPCNNHLYSSLDEYADPLVFPMLGLWGYAGQLVITASQIYPPASNVYEEIFPSNNTGGLVWS